MDVASWIAFALAFGLVFRELGLPPLVGYLAAGFALNALGLEGGAVLAELAHLGVLLLLFSVGLKLRLRSVMQPEVWGTALLHLLITALLLAPALHGLAGLSWNTAWLVAAALGFSSTVVAAKVLEQKRELRAFHGRVAIGILIVQDLVAVALLGLAGGHAPSPFALGLVVLPLARPLLHRLLDASGHDELLILCGLLLALVLGGLGFEQLGLSSELGALVLGTLLAGHPRAVELSNALWSLKEVFLVGFFLQIGMSGLPTWETAGYALLLCLLLPLKGALFFFVLLRFGLRARSSFLAGVGLATYSEFGLIVANLATQRGWLGPQWLVLLALTVALSFVLAAPVNRAAHALYARLEGGLRRYELEQRHADDEPVSLGKAEFLIMGMGRVGTGAYDFLRNRQVRVVGLDSDPGKAARHLKEGRRVSYADAEDPALWHTLNLDGVRAVLLAMPDLEAKRIAATELRRRGYRGLVAATSVWAEESEAITAAGADVAFNYFDEVGVGFAEQVWETLHPHGETPA